MRKALVLTGFAFLFAGTAMANERVYMGGSLGVAHHGAKDAGHIKDESFAWGLYGGYKFHPNLGVEVGYQNFGKGEAGPYSTSSDAISADMVARLPISQSFGLYSKLGMAYVDNTLSGHGARSRSAFGMKIGFGAEFRLSQNLSLRTEFVQYRNTPTHRSYEGSFAKSKELINAGLNYSF